MRRTSGRADINESAWVYRMALVHCETRVSGLEADGQEIDANKIAIDKEVARFGFKSQRETVAQRIEPL